MEGDKMKVFDKNHFRRFGWFYVFGSVLVVWIVYWTLCFHFLPGEQKNAARGQFGDMFGGLNALFSALAFAGLIYTISLQKNELQLQREELSATREELQRSAAAQEKSQQALQGQIDAMKQSALVSALDTLVAVQTELFKGNPEMYRATGASYEEIVSGFQENYRNLRATVTKLLPTSSGDAGVSPS